MKVIAWIWNKTLASVTNRWIMKNWAGKYRVWKMVGIGIFKPVFPTKEEQALNKEK